MNAQKPKGYAATPERKSEKKRDSFPLLTLLISISDFRGKLQFNPTYAIWLAVEPTSYCSSISFVVFLCSFTDLILSTLLAVHFSVFFFFTFHWGNCSHNSASQKLLPNRIKLKWVW